MSWSTLWSNRLWSMRKSYQVHHQRYEDTSLPLLPSLSPLPLSAELPCSRSFEKPWRSNFPAEISVESGTFFIGNWTWCCAIYFIWFVTSMILIHSWLEKCLRTLFLYSSNCLIVSSVLMSACFVDGWLSVRQLRIRSIDLINPNYANRSCGFYMFPVVTGFPLRMDSLSSFAYSCLHHLECGLLPGPLSILLNIAWSGLFILMYFQVLRWKKDQRYGFRVN